MLHKLYHCVLKKRSREDPPKMPKPGGGSPLASDRAWPWDMPALVLVMLALVLALVFTHQLQIHTGPVVINLGR